MSQKDLAPDVDTIPDLVETEDGANLAQKDFDGDKNDETKEDGIDEERKTNIEPKVGEIAERGDGVERKEDGIQGINEQDEKENDELRKDEFKKQEEGTDQGEDTFENDDVNITTDKREDEIREDLSEAIVEAQGENIREDLSDAFGKAKEENIRKDLGDALVVAKEEKIRVALNDALSDVLSVDFGGERGDVDYRQGKE